MPARSGLSCLIPALAFGASQLRAQQTQQTVPRELAVAFARAYAPADSNVAIDFVPGAIAPAVSNQVSLPPGARLIGTVVVARNTYIFASSRATPDSILAWYGRDYAQRGWAAFALFRVLQDQSTRGGFRQPPPEHPTSFCSGATVVDISTNRAAGETSIRVRLGPSVVTAPCPQTPGAARPVATNVHPTPQLPLPMLTDPPNSQPLSQCYVRGASQQTGTMLQTTLSLSALEQHYAKQLEAQGWSPMVGDYAMTRTLFSRRDPAGGTEVATLTIGVNPTAPMCRNASIEVATTPRP